VTQIISSLKSTKKRDKEGGGSQLCDVIYGRYLCFQNLLGLPISDVPFPSVIICSEGFNLETFYSAFYKIILEHWKNKTGYVAQKSSYEFAKSMVKSIQKLVSTTSEHFGTFFYHIIRMITIAEMFF